MCQWANFLHTYDELDLSRLPEPERDDVFAAFAPDDSMRIYGRGIRRRPSSMLGGDTRRVMLAYSLLFSLPGTPVLIYGDEIGMGEDLSQPGRFPTRTPMQWSDDPNGGFSTAPADRLVRPVIADGDYAWHQVNVVDAQRDRGSLLNRMAYMIRSRKETPEFGCGEPRILETGDDAVLAHRCDWRGRTAVAVHNLSDQERTIRLDLGDRGAGPIREKLGNREYDAPTGEPLDVTLDGYGFRWFRIGGMRPEVI